MSTGIEVKVGDADDTQTLPTSTAYTVHEESIGTDPTDTTGAAGSMRVDLFNSASRTRVKRMVRKTISLSDKSQGTVNGIVRAPSGNLETTSLVADQRTVSLAVVRTATPFSGSLKAYLTYLLELVGITTDFVIQDSFQDITVNFPGWRDEVLVQMKRLLANYGAEITQASSNIVIRSIRGREAVFKRDSSFSWTMDDSSLALAVEGYWYEHEARTSALAYPPGGWNEDVQIFQVDAGETVEFNLPIEASLSSVNQPIAVDNVDRYYTGPNSVYAVVGADDLPVPAAQWTSAGGSIQVNIGEDTRSLIVRITGASIASPYPPFRIAMSAGPSDDYSSLRITGTGVFFTKHGPFTVQTSASSDETSVEIGATLDSEFVTSYEMMYDAFSWMLSRYGGPRHTVTVQTTGINRIDDSGSYAYPVFEDFNTYAASRGWSTIADFNAAYAGYDFDEFNQEWLSIASQAFSNQAFGNVAGARTFRDGLWFRIRTADITAGSISYNAENDTTVGDFNTWLSGQLDLNGLPNTIASFNLLMAERRNFGEFNAAPLSIEE